MLIGRSNMLRFVLLCCLSLGYRVFAEQAISGRLQAVFGSSGGEIILERACGVPAIQPGQPSISRIVNGRDAVPNSWPWQVSLQYPPNRTHFCGGSIINNQWVITAAHCMMADVTGTDSFVVVISEHDLKEDDLEQMFTVEDYYVHPNYSSITIDNDIALIKLSRKIVFRDEAIPVCLVETTVPDNTMCTVTGWGALEAGGFLYAEKLKELEIYTINQERCRDPDMNGDSVTDNMLCAGLIEGGKGPCFADSGGPLVCQQDGTWFLNGLVSFAVGDCAQAKKPTMFTRVQRYLELINYITGGGKFVSRKCGTLKNPLLLTELSGYVASPGYEDGTNYFDAAVCVWRIEVPTDKRINLNFEDMDIQWEDRCRNDTITVYDGPTSSDNSLGSFCGSTLPAALTSQGNAMLLVFKSDSITNGRGFKVSYTSSDAGGDYNGDYK